MTTTTAPSRVLVIISTVALALVLLFASSVQAGGDLATVDTISVTVRGGDTLWEIASAHTASTGDVRDTIAQIKSLNRLDSSVITPGQVLEVPAG